jgi:hypothetical protein
MKQSKILLVIASLTLNTAKLFSQCTPPNIYTSGLTTFCAGDSVQLSIDDLGDQWYQQTSMGGVARIGAVGFSIGTKCYIGTGFDGTNYLSDFWEFNTTLNAWSQKASFPGGARAYAVAFSTTTNKGYIGTGYNGTLYKNDFWQYDPISNSWVQKANFIGTPRAGAVAFSNPVGTGVFGPIGAICFGYDATTTHGTCYRYVESTNNWLTMANLGVIARKNAIAFSIGGKAYFGLGTSNTGTYLLDFWEYDAVANIANAKANFPAIGRENATAFNIGSNGYVGGGRGNASTGFKKDFWQYNPTSNAWAQKIDIANSLFVGSRQYGVGFGINGDGYIVSGFSTGGGYYNDIWKYSANKTYTWTPSTVSSATIAAKTPGIYTITVADAIGCIATNTILVTFANPKANVVGNQFICPGNTVSIGDTTTTSNSYSWTPSIGLSSANIANPTASPTITTSYELLETESTYGCQSKNAVTIFVDEPSNYLLSSNGNTNLCQGANAVLSTNSNSWIQKSNFGAAARNGSFSFSIGNKGYVGTGNTGGAGITDDFWEYDPATNVWSQKANFAGGLREKAVGFSIGLKGYAGTGNDLSTFKKDFWEYNPLTNIWTKKADFAGLPRNQAIGFSIANKGYLGTGFAGSNGNGIIISYGDFWEYNPATNFWTQKATVGFISQGGWYGCVGFAIGNKGYIATGVGAGGFTNILREYDPTTNLWIQKAYFPGNARKLAVGFSIGNKGYIGTGINQVGSVLADFWEYNATTDAWLQKTNVPGGIRQMAVGFNIGNKGYVGTGISSNTTGYKNDFYEYTPEYTYTFTPSGTASPTKTISVNATSNNYLIVNSASGCSLNSNSITITVTPYPTITVNSGVICPGQSFTINPSGANTYTIQGATSVKTPSVTSTYTVIGSNTLGCVSQSPATSTITVAPTPTITVNSGAICKGNSFTMIPAGAISYTYSGGTAVVSPTTNTTYTVSGANAEGCTTNAVAVVTVNPLPNVTLGSIQSPLCVNNSTVQLIGNPAGGVYSGTGVIGTSFNPAVAGAGTFTVNYNYTAANTCSATASQSVNVSLCTGILELNNETVSVYPNPASNMINVKMNTTLINNAVIELYDATGKLIAQQKVVNEYSSLNINGLSNGIYSVRVITDNEQIIKRIVKQQ